MSNIGVASYGVLGHVPPLDLQQFTFSVHFDLHKYDSDYMSTVASGKTQ